MAGLKLSRFALQGPLRMFLADFWFPLCLTGLCWGARMLQERCTLACCGMATMRR